MTPAFPFARPHEDIQGLSGVTDVTEILSPPPGLLIVNLYGRVVPQEEQGNHDAGGVHEHDSAENGLEARDTEDDSHQNKPGHIPEEVHRVEDAQSPCSPVFRNNVGHMTLQGHKDDGSPAKSPSKSCSTKGHREVQPGVESTDQVQEYGQYSSEARENYGHFPANVVTPRATEEG